MMLFLLGRVVTRIQKSLIQRQYQQDAWRWQLACLLSSPTFGTILVLVTETYLAAFSPSESERTLGAAIPPRISAD